MEKKFVSAVTFLLLAVTILSDQYLWLLLHVIFLGGTARKEFSCLEIRMLSDTATAYFLVENLIVGKLGESFSDLSL